MSELRSKVINLYKHLIYLGREYPGLNGPEKFRKQIREAFVKNKDESDPKRIMALVAQGRYLAKEVEALYSLKKYRSMKQRYE
ncbi:electron transfer flavoprotein regulatory factor 1 [Scaptodrosophila lebanonensis]|uniref:Electron transfer flavoprotein regulatory factor 1 n=1 Tax=Drosophila lebanonensis TaxID=7225 RepID=A0A6J2U7E3_DROLE|nr:electron transfer flavoprotein regulatory factor 1 [Scaptodrosophila lebanonensis]